MTIFKLNLFEDICRIIVIDLSKIGIVVILFFKCLQKFVPRSVELSIAIFKQCKKLLFFLQIKAEDGVINIMLCNYF